MSRLDAAAPPAEVEYPASDGQPKAESGAHVRAILRLIGVLDYFFRDRPDVYVVGDIFLYYEEGNPAARRAPDILVAFGVPKYPDRRSFFTWREGVVPQVLFEFSSDSTVQDDRTAKRDLYESLGVEEYFLFDPLGTSWDPRLQGFHRQGEAFVALTPAADGGLTSAVMGVRFVPEGLDVRVIDRATGEPVLQLEEQADRAAAAQRQAERERRRAERERRRADRLTRQAAESDRRVDDETHRADALAAEVERLRALLGGQGQ
jgi:Uma2 family endonuclease